jgi:hypothetical protein
VAHAANRELQRAAHDVGVVDDEYPSHASDLRPLLARPMRAVCRRDPAENRGSGRRPPCPRVM